MFRVSGAYLSAISDWLRQSGYGSSPLCTRIRRIRASESVALDVAERLLAEASSLTGDTAAALRIGQIIDWPHLGALGHMLSSARTLEELLNGYVYYEGLFYGTNIANLHRDPSSFTLYWNTQAGYQEFSCFSISSVVTVIRQCGVPLESIAAVSFPSTDESMAGLFAEILQCDHILFGRPLGITIRKEFLGREVQVRNQKRDRVALMARLFPEITDVELASRLYDEIAAALPQREANLEKSSGKLAMSPRTLQRRLSAIPDGFRGVVGRVRMQLAMEYLRDESMTLIAVSMLLGYTEQSAFQLAFRRQFGIAPGQWRRDDRKSNELVSGFT